MRARNSLALAEDKKRRDFATFGPAGSRKSTGGGWRRYAQTA